MSVDVFIERYSTCIKSKTLYINIYKIRAILYALCLWLSCLCDDKIIIYNNNAVVVASFNKESIRGDSISPLRDIVIFLAFNNILVESIWIDSKLNNLADLLLRDKYKTIADNIFTISISRRLDPRDSLDFWYAKISLDRNATLFL